MLLDVCLHRLIPSLTAVLSLLLEVIEMQEIRLERTLESHLMHALDLRWDELDPKYFVRYLLTSVRDPSSFWTICSRALVVFSSGHPLTPQSQGTAWAPDQFTRDFPLPPHLVLPFADVDLGRDVGFACKVLNKTRQGFLMFFFYGIVTLLMGKGWPTGKKGDRAGYLSSCCPSFTSSMENVLF